MGLSWRHGAATHCRAVSSVQSPMLETSRDASLTHGQSLLSRLQAVY
jgi:hypothetical protein